MFLKNVKTDALIITSLLTERPDKDDYTVDVYRPITHPFTHLCHSS